MKKETSPFFFLILWTSLLRDWGELVYTFMLKSFLVKWCKLWTKISTSKRTLLSYVDAVSRVFTKDSDKIEHIGVLILKLTWNDTLVSGSEGWAFLISKPSTGHSHEPFCPFHFLRIYSPKIQLNVIFPSLFQFPKWPFSKRFCHQSIHATYPVHCILLDFTLLKIPGNLYKSWSSFLCVS
jgi:hypothetical protein